jgi:hypothetical protein
VTTVDPAGRFLQGGRENFSSNLPAAAAAMNKLIKALHVSFRRTPESRDYEDFRTPVFAGLTKKEISHSFSAVRNLPIGPTDYFAVTNQTNRTAVLKLRPHSPSLNLC